MSHAVNAPHPANIVRGLGRVPWLPRLNHGTRWAITRDPHPYFVRAFRDPKRPESLRVFDTATRRPVMKVTNRPGSDRLPNSDVLFDLLAWTHPALTSPLTQKLSGLCWLLTETASGFELAVRVRVRGGAPGPRVTRRALPLDPANRAEARATAVASLTLAGRMATGEEITADTLKLAVAALNAG